MLLLDVLAVYVGNGYNITILLTSELSPVIKGVPKGSINILERVKKDSSPFLIYRGKEYEIRGSL